MRKRRNTERRRMSRNRIVRFAISNRWLEEQGVQDMNTHAAAAAWKTAKPGSWTERCGVKDAWIVLHYGSKARV
jgi:hypothetical protein